MKNKKSGGGCGCLGAPMRALSRACDSACSLYVRGMSGCARGMPSGSSAGIVGRGFGGSSATSLRLRVSSDKADDLLRAAAASAAWRQRRVAAEPVPEPATPEAAGKNKMLGSGATRRLVGPAAPAVAVRTSAAQKRVVPATMDTIAEDRPCEFGGTDDGGASAVSSMKPPRRAAVGAVKAGSDGVFAR